MAVENIDDRWHLLVGISEYTSCTLTQAGQEKTGQPMIVYTAQPELAAIAGVELEGK